MQEDFSTLFKDLFGHCTRICTIEWKKWYNWYDECSPVENVANGVKGSIEYLLNSSILLASTTYTSIATGPTRQELHDRNIVLNRDNYNLRRLLKFRNGRELALCRDLVEATAASSDQCSQFADPTGISGQAPGHVLQPKAETIQHGRLDDTYYA